MTEAGLADPFGVLRRVTQPRERPRPGEACDMCREPIGQAHSHVADISERRLLCTCRACYLLFTGAGAGARRLRAVPEHYRRVPDFAYSKAQWEELAIPVDVVFLFQQTDTQDAAAAASTFACYPSPAGATQSELDLGAWLQIAAANPLLAAVEPDVEAVLVRRSEAERFDCFVVPIDACYELVGLVRQHWVGFHGGAEVWRHIEDFFIDVDRRAGAAAP